MCSKDERKTTSTDCTVGKHKRNKGNNMMASHTHSGVTGIQREKWHSSQ